MHTLYTNINIVNNIYFQHPVLLDIIALRAKYKLRTILLLKRDIRHRVMSLFNYDNVFILNNEIKKNRPKKVLFLL